MFLAESFLNDLQAFRQQPFRLSEFPLLGQTAAQQASGRRRIRVIFPEDLDTDADPFVEILLGLVIFPHPDLKGS